MALNSSNILSEDIIYILENPWDISQKEWSLYEKSQIERSHLYILDQLKIAENGGVSRIWRTAEQKPIAILGCLKREEKKFETFFVASKHMEDHALKISFEMRDLLREQSTVFKDSTCFLYSTSDHPNQITWFKFMGFTYIPERNTGLSRYFEYNSPKG